MVEIIDILKDFDCRYAKRFIVDDILFCYNIYDMNKCKEYAFMFIRSESFLTVKKLDFLYYDISVSYENLSIIYSSFDLSLYKDKFGRYLIWDRNMWEILPIYAVFDVGYNICLECENEK